MSKTEKGCASLQNAIIAEKAAEFLQKQHEKLISPEIVKSVQQLEQTMKEQWKSISVPKGISPDVVGKNGDFYTNFKQ